MRQIEKSEWEAFLREGWRTAKLGYLLLNGRPTVTPVWFVHDADGITRIEPGGESSKAKALRSDPRASLVVDLEEPPYALCVSRRQRRSWTTPDEVYRVAHKTGARDMFSDRAEEYGKRNRGPGQVVVEFDPQKSRRWRTSPTECYSKGASEPSSDGTNSATVG